MTRLFLRPILVSCLLFSGHTLAQMPRLELAAGFHRIEAEVAATPAHRARGLMHRHTLPANQGMLFVFAQVDRHCMWMRNTFLPLSVAFIDETGRILNIEDMKPQTENNHCAAAPARYALEMNIGWFSRKGLKAGLQLRGLEKSPHPL